ncbi:MAG: ASCH domain-containing protein [Velocimicrobium sp.]
MMEAKEMWERFSKKNNLKETKYEAWAFGGNPDKLAELVLQGVKTGTASAFALYEIEGEQLPKEGDYSVILDISNEAKCIIQTTKVYIVPFDEVSESHAYKEGEGDRSLAYWRRVHEEFFGDCLQEVEVDFSSTMQVVCEEFKVVYQ